MRASAILLLSVLFVSSIQSLNIVGYNVPVEGAISGTRDVVQFLRGLSKGLVGEDLGADFGQCINEGSSLATDIEGAINTIEQGGLTNIVNGIFQVVHVVNDVPMVFSDCKSISLSAVAKLKTFG